MGGEGLSWRDNELNSTAISFDTPGAIQLVGFNPNDNIVRQLSWTEGFPQDFVSEAAEARVWDNVPFKQSNIPLVDGNPATCTSAGECVHTAAVAAVTEAVLACGTIDEWVASWAQSTPKHGWAEARATPAVRAAPRVEAEAATPPD